MDRFEKRRQRLQSLIKDRCGGSISECARRIDRNPSYVSRLLYPEHKQGKRNISDGIIAVLEQAFDLPTGWLDGSEMDADLQAIEKLWPNLSTYKKLAILGLIKAIADSAEPRMPQRDNDAGPLHQSDGGARVNEDLPGPAPGEDRTLHHFQSNADRRAADRRVTPLRRNTDCGKTTH